MHPFSFPSAVADVAPVHLDPSGPAALAVLGPVHEALAHVMGAAHHTLGLPWGWTIVLLVLVVRVALLPATASAHRATLRMGDHAERLRVVTARHGGDARKAAADPELAGAGCGPFGGLLLPIAVQGVVLFALYGTLRDELRVEICRGVAGTCDTALTHGAAAFGPIADLTRPGTGALLVGLIAVVVAAQAVATLRAPRRPGQPPAPLWMAALPALVLVPVASAMPTGVLLYWAVSALLGLGASHLVAWRHRSRSDGGERPTATTPRAAAPG
ncbi:YidC/Oxa1 family membrane protein insertase [Patulibacter americanus]|uniref:YidC/Oxa1 family membrane protein insertase n=1 Tax=Patulibacter americanus TaxID=588672 RepID=UPI0003B60BA2|nr:YidC/Oxa1 family membrane protein insertase [Patulibacter americanus]